MVPPRRPSFLLLLAALSVLAAACTSSSPAATEAPTTTATTPTEPASPSTTTSAPATTTSSAPPPTVARFDVSGVVTSPDGAPLSDATVTAADATAITDADGRFTLHQITAGPIQITRPAWLPTVVAWEPGTAVIVALEPRIVRGIRVSDGAAGDDATFAALLELADTTALNTFVFDTKREGGAVTYRTSVPEAATIGAIEAAYDPVARLAETKAHGLYAITRIVVFEDQAAVRAHPEHQLAWAWIDPIVRDAWSYPLDLAVEACELGFDEVQFDYVRFPSGRSAEVAQRTRPTTQAERLEAIHDFITAARQLLHPLGCAVSADVFGIVMSSPTDQGIGQRPEELSPAADALSPMIYPSHYNPGWLGFEDPNDHPAAVVAGALDDGRPRMASPTLLRPWLQAFFYSPGQIRAEIAEAEARQMGWMLWNIGSRYPDGAIPTEDELAG